MNEIKNKTEEKDVHDFLYTELEESMKQILGSKVSIKNKKNNKGKITKYGYSTVYNPVYISHSILVIVG